MYIPVLSKFGPGRSPTAVRANPSASAARIALALLIALAAPELAGAATPAVPIDPGPASSLPPLQGSPATARPLKGIPQPPRHPFMAANGLSNIHDDAWMTDAYAWSGPLGRSLRVTSNAIGRDCGGITFDRRRRLISVCVGLSGPRLYMFDPGTLDVLGEFALPERVASPGTPVFQDFTGGGYFFLDRDDHVWTATTNRHLLLIGERTGGGFQLRRDYDLNGALDSADRISSALPDWSGRIWFVTRSGKVGTLDRRSGRVRQKRLGEEIQNSFAVDRDGAVYIASDRRLYRFDASRGGRPRVTWRARYRNVVSQKPGQADDGSGTTPTLTTGGYVAITDNAEPMNVVVYRRARRLRGKRRLVCEQPVFERNRGATENSLIAAGRALVVENNFGYQDPLGPNAGALTAPGLARVDIKRNGRGCTTVWTNRSERAPSVVPKLALGNGLVYTYTRDPDRNGSEPWFFVALDFRTGRTVWKRLAGTGIGHNNNYAGIGISPAGTLYLGTIGGILALRDG